MGHLAVIAAWSSAHGQSGRQEVPGDCCFACVQSRQPKAAVGRREQTGPGGTTSGSRCHAGPSGRLSVQGQRVKPWWAPSVWHRRSAAGLGRRCLGAWCVPPGGEVGRGCRRARPINHAVRPRCRLGGEWTSGCTPVPSPGSCRCCLCFRGLPTRESQSAARGRSSPWTTPVWKASHSARVKTRVVWVAVSRRMKPPSGWKTGMRRPE